MEVRAPITVERGYCFGQTRYVQRDQPRDPDDTLEKLTHYGESSPYVTQGRALSWLGGATGAVGVGALTLGAMGSTVFQMEHDRATMLFIVGGSALAASIVFCLLREGRYVKAAEAYNEHLVPKRPGSAPVSTKVAPSAAPLSDDVDDDPADATAAPASGSVPPPRGSAPAETSLP